MAIRDWFFRKPKQQSLPPSSERASPGTLREGSRFGVLDYGQMPKFRANQALDYLECEPAFSAAVNIQVNAAAAVQPVLYRSKRAKNPEARWSELKGGYNIRKSVTRQLLEKDELEQVHNHPVLDLLNGPNEDVTGYAFRRLFHLYAYVVGEAFIVKEGPTDRPDYLFQHPPNFCAETPSKTRPYYTFRAPSSIDGEKLYQLDEVIWSKHQNPKDPRGRGLGAAESMAREIQIAISASDSVGCAMVNRAMPSFHIKLIGDDVGDDQVARMEKEIKSKFGGIKSGGMSFVSTDNIEMEQISYTMVEQEAIALRAQSLDNILAYTGVPRELLGITNDGNRATAESAMDRLHIGCTIPMCEFFRLEMQHKLVPGWGDDLILDFQTPLREDKQRRLEMMKCRPEAYTLNEWRVMAGHDEIGEKGDVYLVNGNLHAELPLTVPSPVDLPDIE